MTREEIRNNAATNYGYAVAGGCIERGYIQDAFERGAEWADAHPVNPWHKASEELPKESSTVLGIGISEHPYICRYMYGHWFLEDNLTERIIVTHWMFIPEIKED